MSSQYPSESDELKSAQEELTAARKRVDSFRRKMKSEPIGEYLLADVDGNEVKFSSLFGEKDDLIVIHNMGKRCSYCTLWADGFNGFYKHLEDRASLVLVSFDMPSVMKEFLATRDWKFRTLSNNNSEFANEMGYLSDKGDPWPGISTFHKAEDGTISRITHAPLGPGDDFCSVWHIFDMLKDGANNWQPKFQY